MFPSEIPPPNTNSTSFSMEFDIPTLGCEVGTKSVANLTDVETNPQSMFVRCRRQRTGQTVRVSNLIYPPENTAASSI